MEQNYIDIDRIPAVLYFAAPREVKELKGNVFLTPYIGIASIFIVDRHPIMERYFKKHLKGKHVVGYNTSYLEWSYPDAKLQRPLRTIHIGHNVKEISSIERGFSEGYIHSINATVIRDRLMLFQKNPNQNRELIYQGDDPLDIISVRKHALKWVIGFDETNMKLHGPAMVIDR